MNHRNDVLIMKGAPGSSAVNGEKSLHPKPIIIGVTGGMASGKSTVARMFSGRGIIHVDADKLVHQLMRTNRTMIAEIITAFPMVKGAHGVNRAALAAHITAHPEALALLESIIHPYVRALETAMIASARRNHLHAVILDIPLLFETDAHLLCDVVIVAHAPLAHRRRRAFARPGMTEAKWNRLLNRQLTDDVRKHAADIVISTAIGKAATRRHVRALMNQWGL
jgi:dephospho-CoA kinase